MSKLTQQLANTTTNKHSNCQTQLQKQSQQSKPLTYMCLGFFIDF